ncbi:MAG TPA: hypothetical protein VGI19_04350 [Candidatus Cybelea sp.]
MRSPARFALNIGAATALLAGCGGSQPPIGAPGAMPRARAIVAQGERSGSRPLVKPAVRPELKEYPVGNPKGAAYPLSLIFDKRGDLWFNAFLLPYLGKMAPNGKVTAHRLPIKLTPCGQEYANEFALGPDHNIWLTDLCGQSLGTVKPDDEIMQKDPFLKTGYSYTAGITTMSRGLWVVITPYGYLAEVSATWKVIKTIRLPNYYCWPGPIGVGYAKTLWIPGGANCSIARVTPDGKVADFPVQAKDGVWVITRGPDGNMWFTAADGPKENAWVGKITPNGQITKYPITDQAWGIAMGPDGNWWITEPYVGHVISMNLQGQVVDDIKLPHSINGSQPRFQTGEIIQGPDGNMWFGEGLRNKIGELIFRMVSAKND